MQTIKKCLENSFDMVLNNVINVKLNERSQHAKIYHIIDIKNLLGVDNLDNFISNTSF